MQNSILCIGEILWDRLPEGDFLGGAPFNVAYHLKKFEGEVAFISRIGEDALGKLTLERVEALGLSTAYIQQDKDLPTGVVDVTFTEGGVPHYTIREPAAWDAIDLDEQTSRLIRTSQAIVFGTLAQRNSVTAQTISSIHASSALKVLDLNLRAPYDQLETVRESLEIADFLKVNDEEFQRLQEWFGLPESMSEAAGLLSEKFNLNVICVTCGGEGAFLFHDGEWIKSGGVKIRATDTIGAGDAFLAVLLTGFLKQFPMQKLLDRANRFGAYIATQKGGTPTYEIGTLEEIDHLPLPGSGVSEDIPAEDHQ